MLKGVGSFIGIGAPKPQSHRAVDMLIGAPLLISGGYVLRKKHMLLGDALMLLGDRRICDQRHPGSAGSLARQVPGHTARRCA